MACGFRQRGTGKSPFDWFYVRPVTLTLAGCHEQEGKRQECSAMERFRFQSFRVYHDAKEYCRFCRDIVRNHIEKADRSLADQISRALNSIVLNIAEGSADLSDAEFARFLGISIRSVYETVAAFDLAALYGYIGDALNKDIEDRAHALVKQLASFRNKLKGNFP
jgi:four helix bundle protein